MDLSPLSKVSVEDLNGGKFKSRQQVVDILWYFLDEAVPLEVKINMLYEGRPVFLQKAKKAYAHLGLKESDYHTLWVRLNARHPHVAMAKGLH